MRQGAGIFSDNVAATVRTAGIDDDVRKLNPLLPKHGEHGFFEEYGLVEGDSYYGDTHNQASVSYCHVTGSNHTWRFASQTQSAATASPMLRRSSPAKGLKAAAHSDEIRAR